MEKFRIVILPGRQLILPCNITQHLPSEISSRLFDLGAAVATPVATSSIRKLAYTEVNLLNMK